MKLKLTYMFLIITGVVIGDLLGMLCQGTGEEYVMWLGNTMEFGFGPTAINFSAFNLTLGLQISTNFLQIIFVLLAIVLAPKVAAAIK
ncbi:MAG: DUF4321 domain-containing protein [Oscillospiraceae bacterium]|nr:DUF4321 domain-containing protein [Oscillospiraceae bacterium]